MSVETPRLSDIGTAVTGDTVAIRLGHDQRVSWNQNARGFPPALRLEGGRTKIGKGFPPRPEAQSGALGRRSYTGWAEGARP